MAFDKEKIKANYSTDKHNVLGDFYIPALNNATSYERAVGYFSSKALLYIIQGLDGLIKNGGKMNLVVGTPLTDQEYDSINNLETREKLFSQISSSWNELINKEISDLNKYRLQVFSWLVKTEKLKIKFALRKPGALFHKKIGVIKNEDFTLVFEGSLNETESALMVHSDNFSVYRSWRTESFEDHGKYYMKEFSDVWNGDESGTITLDVPSSEYHDIKNYWTSDSPPNSDLENEAARKISEMFKRKEEENRVEVEYDFIKPRFPKKLNGEPYQLKDHQVIALNKWKRNNYKGIMALATGSGKTITAIHGVVDISQKQNLVIVVAVPYKILAEQWVEVLRLFNISPIKCWSDYDWKKDLISDIGNFNLEIKDFVAIVVLNDSLKTSYFQDQLRNISADKLVFVGDECHHHGGEGLVSKLLDAKYRLGLSATPWSEDEEDLEKSLTLYYGGIVEKYSLKRAMDEGVLTQYQYNIYPVVLSSEEAEKYEELSKNISKMYAIKHSGKKINVKILQNIIFKRARLLDSIESKFDKLEEVLKKRKPSPYTLFYCGSGSVESEDDPDDLDDEGSIRSISKVTKILHKYHWSSSQFTHHETTNQRIAILNSFQKKGIDAIAAIKILDEGFDVPMCREAFITASSRNERQFIQRRGRILRKAKGKTESIIHDFVVLHDDYENPIFKSLAENEMKRVMEFYSAASNKEQLLPEINDIILKYNISTIKDVKYV
jgi:superfamily II DNA or RNA helicase